mmetsp:Transcript_26922/g.77230  ORF Transcript_26922/g.77230 Transcript_26922/m.77230 type:complete len:211 (+) Transcript_26922:352-984(+)
MCHVHRKRCSSWKCSRCLRGDLAVAAEALQEGGALHLRAHGAEELREDHAERVDVRLHAAGAGRQLLGARVGGRAGRARLLRRARPGGGCAFVRAVQMVVCQRARSLKDLGQTKVTQPHVAVPTEEHVRGLDVAVGAILRVQVLQRHRALVEDVGRPSGPAPVVLLCVQLGGHRRVALGDPGHERVLAAELGLNVQGGLVAGQVAAHDRW